MKTYNKKPDVKPDETVESPVKVNPETDKPEGDQKPAENQDGQ